ncbi:MAG: MoxR family ATPase [Campylobacterales bacterium]|nr:MoxR family ATPase [Campylobacterales bacterium]
MNAHALKQTLKAMVSQKIPAFIWGPPGIGKSSIVKQIAQERSIGFVDLRLALMDPTDLKGIPFYDKERHSALWAPPAFLPREGEGLLFLDELNAAPPAVQASAYQLILDRQVGEYRLPDGWAIVAAGNREDDRGVTYKMPSPLANRFVHLMMEVDARAWRDWAVMQGVDARIVGFIGYAPDALFTFDAAKHQKSFATPRSWAFVDALLRSDMDEALLLDAIGGAIGEELGVKFLSFARVMRELPDIDAILRGEACAHPKRADVLHALGAGLVGALLRDYSAARLEHLLRYALDLEGEFSVMIVQDLQRAGVTMEQSDAFGAWVKRFSYLLA